MKFGGLTRKWIVLAWLVVKRAPIKTVVRISNGIREEKQVVTLHKVAEDIIAKINIKIASSNEASVKSKHILLYPKDGSLLKKSWPLI